jgi:hypothetical protein
MKPAARRELEAVELRANNWRRAGGGPPVGSSPAQSRNVEFLVNRYLPSSRSTPMSLPSFFFFFAFLAFFFF